jgi:hypothetical protein
MATLKELSEVVEKLGFKGTDLHDYIKAEQDRACEDRMILKNLCHLTSPQKEVT